MTMTNIERLEKDELQILKPALCLKEEGFLFLDEDISKEKISRYFLDELKKEDDVLAAKEKGKVLGYAVLKEAKWDSGHFGLRMGSLKIKTSTGNSDRDRKVSFELIQKALKTALSKKFEHLSVKINPFQVEEIQALEQNGFYFTACLVSYILDLKKYNFTPLFLKPCAKARGAEFMAQNSAATQIAYFENKDLDALKKISLSSFSDRNIWSDRFHGDSYLSPQKSDELYVKWLVNCCVGREADIVLCARIKQKPVGFITAKYDGEIKKWFGKKIARIPLNAVDEKYRGRGIYKALACELLSVLKRAKTDYAVITTQLNTKAVAKVWMGLGAKIDSAKMVFHKILGVNYDNFR